MRRMNATKNLSALVGHASRLFSASAVVVTLSVTQPTASAASLQQVSGFGSNPGDLSMFKYVPDSLPASAPLVVALHGCTQQASAYDNETGWTKYADRDGFALVLPEQKTINNQNRCFNWFEPNDIERGRGEALSIKQMIDKMISDHSIDTNRIFVTGLSAGGYMTTVMLATYPEVFAGGGIVAGGPYKCGTGLPNAFMCMNPGPDKSPSSWGNLVRNATPHNGPWPKVSIWHGDADFTVAIKNITENVEQWTNVHGTDHTADVSNTVKGFPHKTYHKNGTPVVETYTITGMGHGTPVDPGSADDECGTPGAFILDMGICSSFYLGKFWGIITGEGSGDDEEPFCSTDSNAKHSAAGRSNVIVGQFYFAKGSWNWMGVGGNKVTALKETRPGFFKVVSSCP